jgi:hypothetical protein
MGMDSKHGPWLERVKGRARKRAAGETCLNPSMQRSVPIIAVPLILSWAADGMDKRSTLGDNTTCAPAAVCTASSGPSGWVCHV